VLFRSKGLLTKLLLPFNLLLSFWQAARVLFRERPDAALGLGGYVAFPGGMMAVLLGRPLVIHEQNAVAGLTNRILARLADRVLLGLPSTLKGEWVGNPVRPEIAALPAPETRFAGRTGRLRLLVIGGSLGAQALNERIPQALALLPEAVRPEVRHQSGARHLEALRDHYATAGVAVEALAFIDDMAAALAWADVAICRAGALTVAEMAAAGLPALFVPFPFAVDDHQTANAGFLAHQDAGWLLQQKELTPEKLAHWLSGLNRPDLLACAVKARALAKPEATARVASVVKEVAA
jgi:UDP-N-acetylglucosamine--N-acetylmuramyl-(pentapeptide) pyrophosphoryl-undecaprenol N-acetylglucosamine transferase